MIVHFKPTDGGTRTDYRPPSRPNASRLDILGHRRNGSNLRTDSISFHNLLVRNLQELSSFYFFVPLSHCNSTTLCTQSRAVIIWPPVYSFEILPYGVWCFIKLFWWTIWRPFRIFVRGASPLVPKARLCVPRHRRLDDKILLWPLSFFCLVLCRYVKLSNRKPRPPMYFVRSRRHVRMLTPAVTFL